MKGFFLLLITLLLFSQPLLGLVKSMRKHNKKRTRSRKLSVNQIKRNQPSLLNHGLASFMKQNEGLMKGQNDFDEEPQRKLIKNNPQASIKDDSGLPVVTSISGSDEIDVRSTKSSSHSGEENIQNLDGKPSFDLSSSANQNALFNVDNQAQLNKKMNGGPFKESNEEELNQLTNQILKADSLDSVDEESVSDSNQDELSNIAKSLNNGESIATDLSSQSDIKDHIQPQEKIIQANKKQIDSQRPNMDIPLNIESQIPEAKIDLDMKPQDQDPNGQMHLISGEEFLQRNPGLIAQNQTKQNIKHQMKKKVGSKALDKFVEPELLKPLKAQKKNGIKPIKKNEKLKPLKAQKKNGLRSEKDKKRIENQFEEIDEINNESGNLYNQITGLQSKDQVPNISHQDLDDLNEKQLIQKELNQLKASNAKLNNELTNVNYIKHQLAFEKEQLEGAQYDLMQRNQNLILMQKQQKKIINDLNAKNKMLIDEINSYNQEKNQAIAVEQDFQTRIGQTQNIEAQYKLKFEALQKEYQKLEADKKSLEVDKNDLREEKKRLNEELSTLKKQTSNQEFFKKNFQKKTKELQRKVKRQDQIKKQLAAKYDVITAEVNRLNQIYHNMTSLEQQYNLKMKNIQNGQSRYSEREKSLQRREQRLNQREDTMLQREKLCNCSFNKLNSALEDQELNEEYHNIIDDCLNQTIAKMMNMPLYERKMMNVSNTSQTQSPQTQDSSLKKK